MRILILPVALLAATVSPAQTQVHQTTFPFSTGSHPTFMVEFEEAEAGSVESWYKGQMKEFSEDVESKKELRFTGIRAADVAPDTITMLCRAEQPRKSSSVNLHLAFMVNGAWVGPTSDQRLVDGATNFAYNKAVGYKKYLLQNQLTEAEKVLARLQSEQATLEKDHQRYVEGIEKNRTKGTEAAADKVQAEAELGTNELAVKSKQAEVGGSPSEQGAKELQDLLKEQAKLKDRIQRLGDDTVNAENKVKDLELSIERNLADQEAKRASIEKQTVAVEELKTTLAAVN